MSRTPPPAEPAGEDPRGDGPTGGPTGGPPDEERAELAAGERRRRRAALLADLAEARELRARVAPRRTRLAKTRAAVRQRLFRFDPPPRRQQ